MGIIYFAVGIIIVLVVLYLVKLVLGWLEMPQLTEPVLFVVGAVCLILLLMLAANVLFGVGGQFIVNQPRPMISR